MENEQSPKNIHNFKDEVLIDNIPLEPVEESSHLILPHKLIGALRLKFEH